MYVCVPVLSCAAGSAAAAVSMKMGWLFQYEVGNKLQLFWLAAAAG